MYQIPQNKIERSIRLIQEFEPYEGYHLAFSGGKDSICLLHLSKLSGTKYTTYFALTTVDPPDVIRFIKRYFPNVKFLRPNRSMFQLIEYKGILPTRKTAYCCEHLKEYAGIGEFVLQGIRWQESLTRSKRKFFERDTRKKMSGK